MYQPSIGIFVFFRWAVFSGALILVECECNVLEAQVLGGIVCVFFPREVVVIIRMSRLNLAMH